MHDEDLLTLALQLEGIPDSDARELDELTRRLRGELLELDVRSVDPLPAGAAPSGTRAADVVAIGGLLVTLAKSGDTLKLLVGFIQSWLHAQPARSVELQIEGDTLKLSGVSSAEQARLIDLFVQRHLVDKPVG
jgi:hypothetical protein